MNTTIANLPNILQDRFNLVVNSVPDFWEQRIYNHFTNHGVYHSQRVYKILNQLIREVPKEHSLNAYELFIVYASSWLYEIGFQSSRLNSISSLSAATATNLSVQHLVLIRQNKHLLAQQLILDSLNAGSNNPSLSLGLVPPHQANYFVAEVCRGCSTEPLDQIPDVDYLDGNRVRLRLLVALLRLADLLYIDTSRIKVDRLMDFKQIISREEFMRRYCYQYVKVLPIDKGLIKLSYSMPENRKHWFTSLRSLMERDLKYENNELLRYLQRVWDIRLQLDTEPLYHGVIPNAQNQNIDPTVIAYLEKEFAYNITDSEKAAKSPVMVQKQELEAYSKEETAKTIEDIYQILNTRFGIISEKLDNIDKNVDSVLHMQITIYQKLPAHDQNLLEKLFHETRQGRIEQSQLLSSVATVRNILMVIEAKGVKISDPDVNNLLKEIYESINSTVSVEQQFELAIPIIPFLLQYKLNFGGGVDLAAVWQELQKRLSG